MCGASCASWGQADATKPSDEPGTSVCSRRTTRRRRGWLAEGTPESGTSPRQDEAATWMHYQRGGLGDNRDRGLMTEPKTRPDRPAGPSAPSASAPAVDPVSVIRSRAYVSALVLAGLLGVPISVVAYGFLAVVSKVQTYLFTDLPGQLY